MARQVSLIIADMIKNRIEASELSDIKRKYAGHAKTAEEASALVELHAESGKILEGLNEDFEELLNELEICLRRR